MILRSKHNWIKVEEQEPPEGVWIQATAEGQERPATFNMNPSTRDTWFCGQWTHWRYKDAEADEE